MGWFDEARQRLAELRNAAVATYDRDAALVSKGYQEVRAHGAEWVREGAQEVRDHGLEWAKEGLKKTYDFVIGDDINTLMDPKKSVAEKGLAALSIASNFIGPEGKLGVKVGELALKEIMEHGGEKLLAAGLKELERRGGREAIESVERVLLKNVPELAAKLEPLGVKIGKGITAINSAHGAYEAAINLPDHVRKTIDDTYKALTDPNATPMERAKLLAEAAKNGFATVQDVLAMKKALDAVRGHTERAQTPTPAEQRRILQGDHAAELTKIGGATMVQTEHAIIDCRPGKTMTEASYERLVALKEAHPDKMVIVLGKNLDEETKFKLAHAGITVATTDMKLTIEQLAAKMPGGSQILAGIEKAGTLNPAANPDRILHAVVEVQKAHKSANDARNAIEGVLSDLSPQTLEKFRNSGPAEVGIPHLQAKPYDGASRSGSVTFVNKDHVEQYVGGGEWRAYDLSHDLQGLRKALAADKFGQNDPALPTKIEPGDRLDVAAGGRVTLTPADRSKDVLVVDPAGHAQHHPQQQQALASLGGSR